MNDGEQIQLLYKICQLEFQQLLQNMTTYEMNFAKILDIVSTNGRSIDETNVISLLKYDNFCANISSVTNFARKFNLHLQLHSFEKTTKESPPCNGLNIKQQNDNTEINYDNYFIPPIELNDKPCFKAPKEVVSDAATNNANYVQKNLMAFETNSLLTALVTNVECKEPKFYVCDVNDAHSEKITQLGNMKHLKQYATLPAAGIVFGLVLDDVIFRAVRHISEVTVPNSAWLIDLAEAVDVNDDDIMYQLRQEFQCIPAQAIPCLLLGKGHESASDLVDLLKSWKYQRVQLKVAQNATNVLYVQETADEETTTRSQSTLTDTNPFRNGSLSMQKATQDADEAIPASAVNDKVHKMFAHNNLTAEELEMLYEEEECTTNAMKAVMGYDPKDEKRICRFYNVKTNSCFKGANCRQEHELMMKDGWTKDVQPAANIMHANDHLHSYANGTVLTVTPTFIESIERFYGQISDRNKLSMEPLIWMPEDIPDLYKLQRAPMLFDLVLARYKDGMWYRAKITDMDDNGKYFKVFYVDYGNTETVPLRCLAKCDAATAQWPFQAALCRLADVRIAAAVSMQQRKLSMELLCKTILNVQIRVEVVCQGEELLVRIIDKQYRDLPKKLIDFGL